MYGMKPFFVNYVLRNAVLLKRRFCKITLNTVKEMHKDDQRRLVSEILK